jgi:hypothetical protein
MTLRIEKVCGNSRSEIVARHLSKLRRIAEWPRRRRLEKPRAIGFQHDGVKHNLACGEARVCADRRFAGAIENPQKGALCRKRNARRRIENRRQESPSGVIAAAHGDGNRALARRAGLHTAEHAGQGSLKQGPCHLLLRQIARDVRVRPGFAETVRARAAKAGAGYLNI